MKNILLTAVLLVAGQAFAVETSCEVKGMHCTGCTEMVEGKVCDEAKYSTCEVKVTDEKKQVGVIHLVTKDAKAKVDEKALSKIVTDAGYKLSKCSPKKADKAPAKKV